MTILDEAQPVVHFGERHERAVAATPEQAWAAVEALTFRDIAATKWLMALRSLPKWLASGSAQREADAERPERRILDHMVGGGALVLGRREGELALGMIGQFWRLRPPPSPRVGSAAEFLAFEEPGFAKIATDVLVEPAPGGALVVTRTHVVTTDAAARESFGRYWRLIRPVSGGIRRDMLRAVDRLATAGQAGRV